MKSEDDADHRRDGKPGRATLHNLLARASRFAPSRASRRVKARALANNGVAVVQGDLNDAESLKRALAGAWGVYAVQNTWEGCRGRGRTR